MKDQKKVKNEWKVAQSPIFLGLGSGCDSRFDPDSYNQLRVGGV